MRNYLSLGMGTGSVALMLHMLDKGMEFEAVFIDHGGDWPETYEYAEYLAAQGYKFTRLVPNVRGYTNLYEFCVARGITPSIQHRWCTGDWKVAPFNRYVGRDCNIYLGITYDERHRAKPGKHPGNRWYHYPFVDERITRDGAIQLIKDHGLRVPPRSSCWFCPFMKKKDIVRLYVEHPELYAKLEAMEASLKPGWYIKDRPLSAIVPSGCPTLDWFEVRS